MKEITNEGLDRLTDALNRTVERETANFIKQYCEANNIDYSTLGKEVNDMGMSSDQRAIIMDKVIELAEAHPEFSYTRLGAEFGLSHDCVSKWIKTNKDGFGDRYKETLRSSFNRLEGLAIKTLGDLLVDGNWQACKYVLDATGYKPVEKTEVKADVETAITQIRVGIVE